MNTPHRVQLSRAKGWRKPDNTIVVARPSKWGNRYRPIMETGTGLWRIVGGTPAGLVLLAGHVKTSRAEAIDETIHLYRVGIEGWAEDEFGDEDDPIAAALQPLRGKNLACWCALEDAAGARVPCHADVLLELANKAQS